MENQKKTQELSADELKKTHGGTFASTAIRQSLAINPLINKLILTGGCDCCRWEPAIF